MDQTNVFIAGIIRFADDKLTNCELRRTSIVSAVVIVIVVAEPWEQLPPEQRSGGATGHFCGPQRNARLARSKPNRHLAEASTELERFAYTVHT